MRRLSYRNLPGIRSLWPKRPYQVIIHPTCTRQVRSQQEEPCTREKTRSLRKIERNHSIVVVIAAVVVIDKEQLTISGLTWVFDKV